MTTADTVLRTQNGGVQEPCFRNGVSIQLRYQNCINGKWVDSASGRRFAVFNPADLRELCHEYPLSTREDACSAVQGAQDALGRWRSGSLSERVTILRRAAQIIRSRRLEIAEIITRENGKLIAESLTEIVFREVRRRGQNSISRQCNA